MPHLHEWIDHSERKSTRKLAVSDILEEKVEK